MHHIKTVRSLNLFVVFVVVVYMYLYRILQAAVYSKNDLVALRLEKPERFKYESGSYLYVNCKDIALCEW